METGLREARRLLITLADMGVPAATEFLEPLSPPYLADLVSWGSIGARTTASQPHRLMASGLPMPVGFKNATNGDLDVAVNAVVTGQAPHRFMGIDEDGRVAALNTLGNPYGHIVLRGGKTGPNYDSESIAKALDKLKEKDLSPRLIVDCSHANCQKNYSHQEHVFKDIIRQATTGSTGIAGAILESHLNAGSQDMSEDPSELEYAVSLTDPCISWATTERLVRHAYATILSAGC